VSRQFFGTDGIRGEVGKHPINPEFMLKLGYAVGKVLGQSNLGKVLIGKDTRISGYMFESALEAGLSAAGMDVLLLGPMPTPGIAYLTRTLRADAGIVISASHNAYQDNGVKFFTHEGSKLADDIEIAIEAEISNGMEIVASNSLGKAVRVEDAAGRYIEFCKSSIPTGMQFKGMKIVVDCANGATYHIAPKVFHELGAEVISIGNTPDGLNINKECGSTYIKTLQASVTENKADLGIALDGDGDRVIMVDHEGQVVDGDEILYIIACSRYEKKQLSGSVIGTLMSNLGLEHALQRKHIQLVRAQVGDRYVMAQMRSLKSNLGGEGSGHIICLDKTTTGDGIVSALQVLATMVEKACSLSELKSGMSKYPQTLVNVKVASRVDLDANSTIQNAVKEVESELSDRGRVLLRYSGTEPLVRVMVEGRDDSEVNKYANQLASVVKQTLAAN